MSMLSDKIERLIALQVARLPGPLQVSGRDALRRQHEIEREEAQRAVEEESTIGEENAQVELVASKHGALAAVCDRLRSEILVKEREMVELSNALVRLRSEAERRVNAIRRRLVPPHQLEAARELLKDEKQRIESMRIQTPPMVTPLFEMHSRPDPRYASEAAQDRAIGEALTIIVEAERFLEQLEKGKVAPPEDLHEWIDREIGAVRALVEFTPGEETEPGLSSEQLALLKLLSTGATMPIILR